MRGPVEERRIAVTRGIPDSYARATARTAPVEPIDVARARAQHRAYVSALLDLGLSVLELPPAHDLPDSCFVEDCALVAGGVALAPVLGAPSRRPESPSVIRALEPYLPIERMAAPATLDGGDCLRLGRTIYIGRSARTSGAGIERAREVFGPAGFEVVGLPLPPGALHLKEVASPLSDRLVLVADGSISSTAFAGAEAIVIPEVEGYAANVLAIGPAILMPAGFPRTRALVEARGLRVIALEMSELKKGDGSMTCLSIIL